jgi:threonine/homoserine/homoserine lactone efflux protein
MNGELAAFIGVSALVIMTPGQDTVLTIRNTLAGGRPGGLSTAAGVAAGQAIWTVATSAGVAALLIASEPAFLAVKYLGAAYLIYLGVSGLRLAFTGAGLDSTPSASRTALGTRIAFRQGVISNLGNPKMAVFFSSLLPQFIDNPESSLVTSLALGLTFCLMTFTWLTGYAFAVARAGDFLRRTSIRRRLEAITGAALLALGIGLVAETRRT